nr:hypothetical protein [Tanacetum cinerariifolium]
MIAILEKYEHNHNFHQIVDFVEASHISCWHRGGTGKELSVGSSQCGQAGHLQKDCKKNTTASASGRVFAIAEGHAANTSEEELQMLIDGLDINNETFAKYLQEYEQFVADLSIRERIELINDLVKYQENYAKVLKYPSQQRKTLSKKQQREFYMSVLKSHSGWKTKHFKGMPLKEIREKFIPVWKQIEDFVPMGSKEEVERVKRKGLRLEQESAKKVKTLEEVSEEDLKTMMQLVPVKEVYVEALQVKHLIIDWEIHTEGQRNYWKIISNEFLLPEDFPTASEERFPLLSQKDATTEEVCTADKVK